MSKTQRERRDFWREIITQQEQSGLSVRAFCRQHNANEHSFYQWRKRLSCRQVPVKFALVDTQNAVPANTREVELILVTGERLRIEPGFDPATLRAVLGVLRDGR